MFDRLIVDDGLAKIVDLGHSSFERFFAISGEIGFFRDVPAVRWGLRSVVARSVRNEHGPATLPLDDVKRLMRHWPI